MVKIYLRPKKLRQISETRLGVDKVKPKGWFWDFGVLGTFGFGAYQLVNGGNLIVF